MYLYLLDVIPSKYANDHTARAILLYVILKLCKVLLAYVISLCYNEMASVSIIKLTLFLFKESKWTV